jgi:hypothetical protein
MRGLRLIKCVWLEGSWEGMEEVSEINSELWLELLIRERLTPTG